MTEPPEGSGGSAGDAPERPPSLAFAEALSVPRNARIGAVVGLLVAVVAYLFRVLELAGPFRGTRQFPVLGPEGYYLALAFVLATAAALLVTSMLTVVAAVRLVRAEEFESD